MPRISKVRMSNGEVSRARKETVPEKCTELSVLNPQHEAVGTGAKQKHPSATDTFLKVHYGKRNTDFWLIEP